MEQSTEKKKTLNYSDLINKNKPFIKKLEKFAVLLFVIGLLLRYWEIEGTNFILLIGTIALTIVYFLFSVMTFEFDENDNLENNNSIGLIIFFYKLSFLGAAISIISFVGLVIVIHNPNIVLIIGGLNLIISILGTLYMKSKNEIKAFDHVYYIRLIIIIVLLALLSIFKYHII